MGLLGGRWIPLNFFPPVVANVFNLLPFMFLFSFPVQIFQGQISMGQILRSTAIEIFWLGLFLFIGKVLWKAGVKKYEAYGQ
jgi:ABC-2 type transport system permease protein